MSVWSNIARDFHFVLSYQVCFGMGICSTRFALRKEIIGTNIIMKDVNITDSVKVRIFIKNILKVSEIDQYVNFLHKISLLSKEKRKAFSYLLCNCSWNTNLRSLWVQVGMLRRSWIRICIRCYMHWYTYILAIKCMANYT